MASLEIKLRKKFIREINQARKIAPFVPALKRKSKKITKASHAHDLKLPILQKAASENLN